MIKMENINKSYGSKKVLNELSINIKQGDYVAIMGKSGSGKTTLLNILGLLDDKYKGKYELNGINARNPKDGILSYNRNSQLGLIFQSYNLILSMSVYENILLPLIYTSIPITKELLRRIDYHMEELGIMELKNKNVKLLSGGEKQRVAIVRAMVTSPPIILADEPTGNLDKSNCDIVFNSLKKMNAQGKTIVLVTHNTHIDTGANRILELKDGKLYE